MATDNDFIIGIDLGTTNSSMAYVIDGEVQDIENSEGKFITPSVVYFIDAYNIIVGKQAVAQSANKPEHGIYEIKRFMGRSYNAVELNQSLSYLPFKVVENNGSHAVQIIDHNLFKSPEEISSLVLRKIKEDASVKLNQNVRKAVITVPAHFTVFQRKATLNAAEMAGFTVKKLLSEPTAAILNYFFQTKDQIELNNKYWLVYDLGGGTFDVAIAKTEVIDNQQQIKILCVDGDSNLGGYNINNLILNYFFGELSALGLTGFDQSRELRRATNACIEAKEALSTMNETEISIEGFLNEDYVAVPLTRQKFDKMCNDLFQKSIEIVDRCIKKSGIKKQDINEIILVGGSTRITKIQEMLKEYFDGKSLNQTLHPELCVSKGAALQAAMLSNNPHQKEKIGNFDIIEVTSSSLGIAELSNRMNFIIRKDTILPASGSITHATVLDKQDQMPFIVYEGEKSNVLQNVRLGTFRVRNLTPLPPGKCKVEITMNMDINGILRVTAKEKHKNNNTDLEMALVQNKIETTDNYEEHEDDKFEELVELKQYFIAYCEGILYNIKSLNLKSTQKSISSLCKSTVLELLRLTSVNDLDKIIELGKKIIAVSDPLLSDFNFREMPRCGSLIEDKVREICQFVTTSSINSEADFTAGIRVRD